MIRHIVSSSRIKSVGWQDDILEIEFHNGKIYQYYHVSSTEYISFMNAPSLGHELSILDKKHPYLQIR